jgi:uncharacterized protein YjbI with pentapeptide repeats
MLFEFETFDTRLKKPASWSDSVFRYCDFVNISDEGAIISAVFIGCTFENCDWYWANFNCAILVQVKFNNCKFRGTVFSGSKFVECELIDCEFTADNLQGECSFDGIGWYKSRQENCKGLEGKFQKKK